MPFQRTTKGSWEWVDRLRGQPRSLGSQFAILKMKSGEFVAPISVKAKFLYGLMGVESHEVHAMALDLTLILALELNRSVVESLAEKNYSLLQYGHITASTLAVICYVPTFHNGFRRLQGLGDAGTRRRHIRWAKAAFSFRTLGLALMFTLDAS